MNVVVKWLFASDTEQQRPALCFVHGKQMLCIQAGHMVRTVVRPASEFIGLRNVAENDKPYSISKAITKLHESGRRIGITKSAQLLLAAIHAADDSMLIDSFPLTDEEGLTMINDEDQDDNTENTESSTSTPTPKRRLPPPKAKVPSSKKPVPVASAAKTDVTITPKKETTMATKKTPAKKTKTVAKKKASPAAKKAPAAAGEGGFRAGSNMEKGFIAYKADRKEYQKFERGDKQAWAEKLASKLDTTLNSVRTMISKNWEPQFVK